MNSLLRNRVFLACFGLFGFSLQFCIANLILSIVIPAEWLKTTAKTTPTNQKTESKASNCVTAGGVIWTDARLHLDSSCSKPFATVLGGTENRNGLRMVKIRFDTGEVEWKAREAVADQVYVKLDDPALKAMKWYEIND
jgi:hypothetical protein